MPMLPIQFLFANFAARFQILIKFHKSYWYCLFWCFSREKEDETMKKGIDKVQGASFQKEV